MVKILGYDESFNPHTHEGCDTNTVNGSLIERIVSIHTPTKGVTNKTAIAIRDNLSFNPHTHEGCDKRATQ